MTPRLEKSIPRAKALASAPDTLHCAPDSFSQAPERDLMRVLEPMHYGIFKYVGLEVLPPYMVYGLGEMSEPERREVLEDYRGYLLKNKTARAAVLQFGLSQRV